MRSFALFWILLESPQQDDVHICQFHKFQNQLSKVIKSIITFVFKKIKIKIIFSQLDYIKPKKLNPTLNNIERDDLIASLIYLGPME